MPLRRKKGHYVLSRFDTKVGGPYKTRKEAVATLRANPGSRYKTIQQFFASHDGLV